MKPHGWLLPLSIPYQAAVQLRNRFYDRGIIETGRVAVPVISIGNLSVGGTGKTPFVMFLSEEIKKLGLKNHGKSVIISRGYKGHASGTLLVSDGRRILATPDQAGDEPAMMAEKLRDNVVIVDKNRLRAAQYATDNFKVNQILLDDGFQHRKIHRDLNLVLLDAENPLGNHRVLPAGFLREPVSALSRADLVVLSKAIGSDEELINRGERLQELLKIPVVVTRLKPTYWRRVGRGELLAATEIKDKKTLAFAGLAKPASFFDTVAGLGADLVGEIGLPDHCQYARKVIDFISLQFVQRKSEWLVTTAKDSVKLPEILKLLPLYYLETIVEIVFGERELHQKLRDTLKRPRTNSN